MRRTLSMSWARCPATHRFVRLPLRWKVERISEEIHRRHCKLREVLCPKHVGHPRGHWINSSGKESEISTAANRNLVS